MSDGKQTEASGDSHAFMDALWSAFTATRCDVEVKVLGLIEAHDAALLASSQGQMDEANGELERLVVMIDRVYCDEDYEIPKGETSWSAIDEVRRLLLAAHPQPDGLGEALAAALMKVHYEGIAHTFGLRVIDRGYEKVMKLHAEKDGPCEICDLIARASLAQPEPSQKPDACEWFENDDGFWAGSCGILWSLEAGNLSENGMKFCPKCGKKLVEKARS